MQPEKKPMIFGLGSVITIHSPKELGEQGFTMHSAAVEAHWGKGAGKVYEQARMARWKITRAVALSGAGK